MPTTNDHSTGHTPGPTNLTDRDPSHTSHPLHHLRADAHTYIAHHHAATNAIRQHNPAAAIHHTTAMRDLHRAHHNGDWLHLRHYIDAVHEQLLTLTLRSGRPERPEPPETSR